MIPMQDWMLVAGLVGVSVLITFALSSIYYAQRVYELQREHVEDMQKVNHDLIQARTIVRETKMQTAVMGSVPVSRLIGDNDGVATE